MSETKLKTCPFCGRESMVLQNDDRYYYVGCNNAECRGYVFYSFVYYRTKEEAIAGWDKRKPIEDIVEQLRDKLDEPQYQHYGETYFAGIVDALEIVIEGGKHE